MQDNTNNAHHPVSTTPVNINMQPSDFTTISYRLDGIEKQVVHLQAQLQMYVPQRENELQLRSIQDSVKDIKDDVAEIRKQINDMTQKMINQETEAQKRDNAQRESQDKMQIRALWFFATTVIGILGAVLVGYLTHFFH